MTAAPKRNPLVDSYILSPAEAFDARREADEFERTAPKLYWCNQTLGRTMSPMLLGEFIGVMAYTNNGKTSFALAQSYFEARKLMRDGMDTKASVAYYTWDQPAEKLEAKIELMLARDLGMSQKQYDEQGKVKRMALPLWWGGKNKRHQRKTNYRLPPLTLDLIDDVLNEICYAEKKPALVVVDYVQRVPLSKSSERSDTVLRVAEELADFGARQDVTIIMCIQAARTVLSRADKTPLLHEAQWSSGIEQACDKMISLWRPKTSEKEGTPIQCGAVVRPVDNLLMRCNALKDRGAETNIELAFPFDMAQMRIGDYE